MSCNCWKNFRLPQCGKYSHTVDKFDKFAAPKISRDINFGKSIVSKMAIWEILGSMILRHFGNFHRPKWSKFKVKSLWNRQNGHFWNFRLAKIVFTENLSGSKILKYQHCATALFSLTLSVSPQGQINCQV